MTTGTKAQEPTMEEILASIRRIIADDDPKAKGAKAEARKPEPKPDPKPAPKPAAKAEPAGPMSQDDIDAMLAGFDAPGAADEPDVLDLTEEMVAEEPAFRTIDARDDIVYMEEAPAPRAPEPPPRAPDPPPRAPDPPPRMEAPRPAPPLPRLDDEDALLSHTTNAAVSSAFGQLAHTILMNNSKTLEDLVKEMLRPLLKNWLDDNLPGLVERLVRAEIERVSRGRP